MTAIAQAESGCRVDDTGDTALTYTYNNRVYGYSVGAFQVRILQGREACDSHNLQINVQCAYNVYRTQGLRAWTTYSNNKFKQYL